MSNEFNSHIRGTTETIFRFGKGGAQLKKTGAAVLESRDSVDGGFALHRGLAPVGDDDFVTKKHFDDNNAAATGLTVVKLPLALATKISTGTLPNNAIIKWTRLDVTTAYDAGALWAVKRTGDASVAPIGTADNDPSIIGTYDVPQCTDWGTTGAGTVTATLSGGSPTVGVAVLYIAYTTPNDIS